MTETLIPSGDPAGGQGEEYDPRAKLYSPKGFERRPEPKPEASRTAPDDDIVRAVAAAAKMLGVDRIQFAEDLWGDSDISVTDEQRHRILRRHDSKDPREQSDL
jgi:hypothetical protein